jgi:hypothetical protein
MSASIPQNRSDQSRIRHGAGPGIDTPAVNLDDARSIALALPTTSEAPHHQRTSFRVAGKIFATALPGDGRLNVMVDEPEVRAAVERHPWCRELWWGKRLTGVTVDLAEADPASVRELLEEAWRIRAPARR